jgi:hypothetical protein
MKPFVARVSDLQEASQSLQNPDMRFSPNYIAHNGVERYEGVDYDYNSFTGHIVWTVEDKKLKLKAKDKVAYHY